jgi:hypothetical protein
VQQRRAAGEVEEAGFELDVVEVHRHQVRGGEKAAAAEATT